MKKGQLLYRPMKPVRAEIIKMVEEDKGEDKNEYGRTRRVYKYSVFYEAEKQKSDVLEIRAYTRKRIASGDYDPQFLIFLTKEGKFWTYDVDNENWKTAKIDRLQYDTDTYFYYGAKKYSSEEDREIVGQFTKKEGTLYEMVRHFQTCGRHKSEIDEIDSLMDTVPEEPEDFDDWIMEEAFYNDQYMIYKYSRKIKEGYCTVDKEWVHLEETPKHNQPYICPKCGRKLTGKSWDKQMNLDQEASVCLLQKRTCGGYVVRRYHVRLQRRKENFFRIGFAGRWEKDRILVDEHLINRNGSFYFGEYKGQGFDRWCYDRSYYAQSDLYGFLYSKNMDIIREMPGMTYMPVEQMLGHGNSVNVIGMVKGLTMHPELEKLIKQGATKLAYDISRGREVRMDRFQTKAWRMLGIEKTTFKMLIELNGGGKVLNVLKVLENYKVRLEKDEIEYLSKHVGAEILREMMRFGHIKRMVRYCREQFGYNFTGIMDYRDYLDDMLAVGVNRNKADLFPRDFQKVHLEFIEARRQQDQKIKDMQQEEKDKAFAAVAEKTKEYYYLEDDEMFTLIPKCKADFQKEGRNNHNCVGGRYFDDMLKGQTIVFFLRKKAEPEKSFCTVEMKGDKVIQCRAALNKDAPQEAKDFIKKVSAQVHKKIQEELRKVSA